MVVNENGEGKEKKKKKMKSILPTYIHMNKYYNFWIIFHIIQ